MNEHKNPQNDKKNTSLLNHAMASVSRTGTRIWAMCHHKQISIPIPVIVLGCLMLLIVGITGGQSDKNGNNKGSGSGAPVVEKEKKVSAASEEGDSEEMTDEEIDTGLDQEDQKLFEMFEKIAAEMDKDPNSPEAKRLQAELEALLDAKTEEARKNRPVTPVKPVVRPTMTAPRTTPKPRPIITPPVKTTPAKTTTSTPANTDKPNTIPPPANQAQAAPDKVNEPNTPAQDNSKTGAVEAESETGDDPRLSEPDAIVIKTDQDVIDLEKLLDIVGKELKLNFLYDAGTIPSSKVKLQQYGTIKREHLLDLLEKILSISGYSMVKDDPYIRILKTAEVVQKTESFNPLLDPMARGGDASVVSQLIEVKYAKVADVKAVLGKFVSDGSIIGEVPKTNYLIITDYARRMPRYLEIIAMIDQPGGQRTLEIFSPQYLDVDEAKNLISTILKELDSEFQGSAEEPGVSKPTPSPLRTLPGLTNVPRPELKGPEEDTPAEASAAAGTAANAEAKGASMIPDKRTNRLYVIGTARQIEQIRELMTLVDVIQPGPNLSIVSIYMEYTEAKYVHGQLESLLKALHEDETASKSSSAAPPTLSNRITVGGRTIPTVRQPGTTTPEESASSGGGSSTSGAKGPFMLVDERVNRIILVGSDEQLQEVQDLIKLLDIPIPGDPIEIKTIKPVYLLSDDAAGVISDLLEALNANKENRGGESGSSGGSEPSAPRTPTIPGRPTQAPTTPTTPSSSSGSSGGFLKPSEEGPFLMSDARTNRLFIVGTQVQINQVMDLMQLLDVAAGPSIKLEMIDIRHISPDAAADQLSQLLEAMVTEEVTPGQQDGQTSNRQSSPRLSPRAGAPTAPQVPGVTGAATSNNNATSFIKPTENGPFLMADARIGRLFVVGSDEQIAKVRDLLLLLDIEKPEGRLQLEMIRLKNILPEPAAEQLSQLIEALNQDDPKNDDSTGNRRTGATPGRTTANFPNMSAPAKTDGSSTTGSTGVRTGSTTSGFVQTGANGPFLMPDNRINRLIVVGYRKQIDQVKELLEILDIDIELELVPIQIEYVLSGELVPQLANLFSVLKEQEAQQASGGNHQPVD